MVLKFGEFITEAKKDKGSSVEFLVKVLKDKPSIKMGDTFPNEKGAYTASGLKKYFVENGFKKSDVDDALHALANDKQFKSKYKIEYFRCKNYYYNENYPYNYMDLSKEQVEDLKSKMEEESKGQAKPKIEQREATKKKSLATKKAKEEKSVERKTAKKTVVKKTTKPTGK